MLSDYFGRQICNFLFLQVKIGGVCFLVQCFNFVFEVHTVFGINFMNHSQLIVYHDELIRNHLIRPVLIYFEALGYFLEDHGLGLRLL